MSVCTCIQITFMDRHICMYIHITDIHMKCIFRYVYRNLHKYVCIYKYVFMHIYVGRHIYVCMHIYIKLCMYM